MKTWPKFPDPVEVPTFAQNSKWVKKIRLVEKKDPQCHICQTVYSGDTCPICYLEDNAF